MKPSTKALAVTLTFCLFITALLSAKYNSVEDLAAMFFITFLLSVIAYGIFKLTES